MSDSAAADRILGYLDRISARPGDRVGVMLSCAPEYGPIRIDVARVFCATDVPNGPGLRLASVETPANGDYPARFQPIRAGSSVRVEARGPLAATRSFTVAVLVWPTLPARGRQALVSRWVDDVGAGFRLFLDSNGSAAFQIGDGADVVEPLLVGHPLPARQWALAAASFDADSGQATVACQPLGRYAASKLITASRVFARRPAAPPGTALTFAAWQDNADPAATGGHFNGKLERPCLLDRALPANEIAALLVRPRLPGFEPNLIGDWDFSIGIEGDSIEDVSGNGLHGVTVNTPTRAVCGRQWSGESVDWTRRPSDYAAIHFHEDDLTDCGWQADLAVEIGADWPSGIYAVRARASKGSLEEHFPFFVQPPRGRPAARAVFLASTATYLAYANIHRFHRAVAEPIAGKLTTFVAEDLVPQRASRSRPVDLRHASRR